MSKFFHVVRLYPALLLTAVLFLPSCDALLGGKDEPLEVSVKNSTIGSDAVQQLVSIKCSGDWTLWLVSDDEEEVDWARLSVTSGSGNRSSVILTIEENTAADARTLRLVLDAGAKWAECSITQDGTSSGAGSTGGGISGDAIKKNTGWLELPSMTDPDLGYYSHSFRMNGKTYRNYTFGWSQDDRVALWVAYPLCKLYTNGSAGRTEAWALDPLLGDLSAAPFSSYAGSYARGHQLPSADRQCCDEANAQTFYGTNIVPQLDAHNSGIWANLENKVRSIANHSDTTYVVTGVVLGTPRKTEKDTYGNTVAVPTAFFKALLRYSTNTTLGSWNAAAFYLEHKSYSGNVQKEHAMSIDELEQMLGIDLFVNLPAKVGVAKAAEIEADDPTKKDLWW